MSAIGAIVWSESTVPVDDAAYRMRNALRIYGPDRDIVTRSWPCDLILTLATGFTPEDAFEQQPVVVGGRWRVVFNGLIFNRDDMVERLNISKNAERTIPDSAVFAQLWERWQAQAIELLDGSFSGIVWDDQERILYAVRSIGSAPPLHYHHTAKRTAIATAPKGLFAIGDLDRQVDETKLSQNLLLDFDDRERSYFKEVSRLPTGHMLELKGGRIRIEALYDPRNIRDVRFKSDDQYIDAARDQLDRAVREHSRACEAPAIALSSGLDSSAVAISAIEHFSPDPLVSFTAVPDPEWDGRVLGAGRVGDERGPVKALARAYPALETNFLDCAGMDATAYLEEFFLLAELPPRNVTNLGWFTSIAKSARSRGKRVLLTGESGNASISFEREPSIGSLLSDGRIMDAAKQSKLAVRHALCPPDTLITRDWSATRSASLMENTFAGRMNSPRDTASRTLFGGARDEAGDLALALQAISGVQLRDPLGDRRLAEFCIGLPPSQFDKRGVARRLIKCAMGDRLPGVLARVQRGRQAADIHLRLSRKRHQLSREIEASKSHSMISELVDLDRLSSLMETWPKTTPLSKRDHPDFLLVHVGLPRALANIRFARWLEGANR